MTKNTSYKFSNYHHWKVTDDCYVNGGHRLFSERKDKSISRPKIRTFGYSMLFVQLLWLRKLKTDTLFEVCFFISLFNDISTFVGYLMPKPFS